MKFKKNDNVYAAAIMAQKFGGGVQLLSNVALLLTANSADEARRKAVQKAQELFPGYGINISIAPPEDE